MDKNKSNAGLYPRKLEPIVILVEGVDCSGKSTLVEALSKKYPGILLKLNYRPKDKSEQETLIYKRHVYSMMSFINDNRKDKSIILDRFYSSELVYSKVKRKYDAFKDSTYFKIDKSLSCLPNLYIYCSPGNDVIIERLKQRGDDYIDEKDVQALSDRYDLFYEKTTLNKMKVDTTKNIEELLKLIEEKIQNEYPRS